MNRNQNARYVMDGLLLARHHGSPNLAARYNSPLVPGPAIMAIATASPCTPAYANS
ncbi:MAG: hypothetical protein JWQ86_3597 [Mycobacterium sp.]|nr:hypothetical protein [Mycobacterium sp.]MDT5214919.1 hypothetical protein [Mycobacterium sp.]